MDLARTLVAATLLVAAHSAAAADQGFYFGVLGGQAKYEFDELRAVTLMPPPPGNIFVPSPSFGGVNPGFISGVVAFAPIWQPGDDDESAAWGVIAGYRVMRYAAVELNYLNLGTLKESETFSGLPPLFPAVQINRELETTGPSLSALGILPLLDQWSVHARAGVLFADMELSSSINGFSSSTTFGSERFLWGAGTQFDWGKHWSVRLDFQRFEGVGEERRSGRADIDLLSLGVVFRL